MKRTLPTLAAAAAAALLLAPQAARAETAPDFSLRKAPQFSEPLSLSDLRGQVVVVNFWATWCAPCLAEMDAFKSVYAAVNDTNRDGKVDDADKDASGRLPLEILSISTDESRDRAKINSTIAPKRLPWTILWDQGQKVSQIYNPAGVVPFTVIVDKDGNIVEKITEYAQGEECHVFEVITRTLGQSDVPRPPQCQG